MQSGAVGLLGRDELRIKQGAGPSDITNLFVAIHLLPCRMQRSLNWREPGQPILLLRRGGSSGDLGGQGLGLLQVRVQPHAQKFLNARIVGLIHRHESQSGIFGDANPVIHPANAVDLHRTKLVQRCLDGFLLKQGTTDKNPHHQQHKPEGQHQLPPDAKAANHPATAQGPCGQPVHCPVFHALPLSSQKCLCRTGHRSGAVQHRHLLKCLFMICTRVCRDHEQTLRTCS